MFLYKNTRIHEINQPNLLNQEKTLATQFDGMSDLDFTYADFEETRIKLITTIKNSLTSADKEFILGIRKTRA